MGKLLSLDPLLKGAGKLFGGGDEGVISAVLDPGNLRDKVTGKSEKEAGKKKADAANDAADLIRIQTEKAREDIFRLFPMAQQNIQQGFQGAADIFGQSLPAQTDVFQQGNINAQQAILSGLPQIQNALLGNQIDFSQLQPSQVQAPDLSFFNQILPQTLRQQELDAIAAQQPIVGPATPPGLGGGAIDLDSIINGGSGGIIGPDINQGPNNFRHLFSNTSR